MEHKTFKKIGNVSISCTSDGDVRINGGYDKSITLSLEDAARVAVELLKAIAYTTKENTKSMQDLPDALKEVKKAQEETGQVLDRFSKLLDD